MNLAAALVKENAHGLMDQPMRESGRKTYEMGKAPSKDSTDTYTKDIGPKTLKMGKEKSTMQTEK